MKKKTTNAIQLHTESGKPCTECTRMRNDIQREHNPEILTFLLDFQVKLQEKNRLLHNVQRISSARRYNDINLCPSNMDVPNFIKQNC